MWHCGPVAEHQDPCRNRLGRTKFYMPGVRRAYPCRLSCAKRTCLWTDVCLCGFLASVVHPPTQIKLQAIANKFLLTRTEFSTRVRQPKREHQSHAEVAVAHRTLAILFLLLASVATLAQNGIPPNTTMVPVPLGFVNPLTGHLHLEIPISSIPERNGDPLITKLVYDSTLYLQNGNGYFGSPGGGINTIFGTSKHGITQFDTTTSACTDSGYPIGSVATYSNFRFRDINNTDHAIVNQNIYTQSVSCYSTTGTRDPNVGFPSTASGGDVDGLGYSFNITNYTQIQVTDVDGTVLDAFGGTPKDTNGNLGGSAPDTLG